MIFGSTLDSGSFLKLITVLGTFTQALDPATVFCPWPSSADLLFLWWMIRQAMFFSSRIGFRLVSCSLTSIASFVFLSPMWPSPGSTMTRLTLLASSNSRASAIEFKSAGCSLVSNRCILLRSAPRMLALFLMVLAVSSDVKIQHSPCGACRPSGQLPSLVQ